MVSENELWIEYGLGIATFLLRFFARWKVVGFKNFAWDDLFAFIAMLTWTVDAYVVHIVVIDQKGSFVGLDKITANEVPDARVHDLTIGSKALFTAWLSYTTLIWSLKASMLFFYSRLTNQLSQQKLVKIMGVICAITYIATILVLCLHCTPIRRNWQIKPYAGDECTLTVLNYIFVASANVFTDAGILAIPIPLIYSLRISPSRKIMISLLLCSGVFVMTAALLRCILSLSNKGNINNSTSWGVRETFVSVLATSAPMIRPIFSKSKWISSSPHNSPRTGRDKSPFPRRFGDLDDTLGAESETVNEDKDISNLTQQISNIPQDLERGESHGISVASQTLTGTSSRSSPTNKTIYATISKSKSQSRPPTLRSKKSIWKKSYIADYQSKEYEDVELREKEPEQFEAEEFTPALLSWLTHEYPNTEIDPEKEEGGTLITGSSKGCDEDSRRRVRMTKLMGLDRPPYKARSYTVN